MGKYILIDTENVNVASLAGVEKLKEEDRIFLFLSNNSRNDYNDKNLQKIKTNASVQQIQVMSGIKNSLDFQLVSFLGLMIGEHRHLELSRDYYIVSNDQGFLSSINLLNGYTNKVNINLVPKMENIVGPVENINNSITSGLSDVEMALCKDLRAKFKSKTIMKIITLIREYPCKDIIDVEMALSRGFNHNPSVFKQAEFILRKYYKLAV